jgi:dTMP kinase
VLCDRYTDSTEAYQGGGRKLGSRAVLQLHKVLCHGLWPDVTILMDSDVTYSVERARRRNVSAASGDAPDENRFERENKAFFNRVHKKYLKIAEREKERVVVVDARKSIEEVHAEIANLVWERLTGARQVTTTS